MPTTCSLCLLFGEGGPTKVDCFGAEPSRKRGRAVIVDNIHIATTCGPSLCVYAYYLVRKIQQRWTVLGQNLQGREVEQ